MRTIFSKQIEDAVYALAERACLRLTPSCRAALTRAAEEESGAAKFALETVLANADTAAREKMAVCQDTGYAVVLAEIG